jgi:citrate synthase
MQSELVSSQEAADYLGIKVQSLYTYASRGLLQSVPQEGRQTLYRRGDLERLKARNETSTVLRWGEPVLSTELTSIEPDTGLRYRGHAIEELAPLPFESVAELLFTGELPAVRPVWVTRGLGLVPVDFASAVPAGTPPLASLAVAVPALAARDDERFGAAEAAELHRGRRLIRRMAALLALGADVARCGPAIAEATVAKTTARALGVEPTEDVAAAIDRALVLCADHGLNASTFAGRVAASAGADLYACTSAALAALSGWRHGGACDRVEALVDEAGIPERAGDVVRGRAQRGETIPGFGHPLYPDGDPRGALLLAAAAERDSDDVRLRTLRAVVDAMARLGQAPPNLDVGLVALASALGLPRGSAKALFAVGRTAGWIAHVMEQRRAGFLLRPRARYVGPRA